MNTPFSIYPVESQSKESKEQQEQKERKKRKKEPFTDSSDLLTLLKAADQLLRKAGIYNSSDRFLAFADVLFLKLMDEWKILRSHPLMHQGLAPCYYWHDFVTRYHDQDLLDFITHSVWPELQTLYGNVFDRSFRINDVVLLQSLIDLINPVSLIDYDRDVLGEAYEYFLKDTSRTPKMNKSLGEFFTPHYLASAMVQLIDPKVSKSICDPFCGTGVLLLETFQHAAIYIRKINPLRSIAIYGNEITANARIAQMNLIAVGGDPENILQGDTLKNPVTEKYDAILTNIPYSQQTIYGDRYPIPTKNGNAICMQWIFQALKQGGRAAVIVPEIFLYGNGAVKKTRELIIRNSTDLKVLSLPRSVFKPYTPTKTNLLYFRKCDEKQEEGSCPQKVYFHIIRDQRYQKDRENKKNEKDEKKETDHIRESLQEFLFCHPNPQNDKTVIKNTSAYINRYSIEKNNWNLAPLQYIDSLSVVTKGDQISLGREVVEEVKQSIDSKKELSDKTYPVLRSSNRDLFVHQHTMISGKDVKKGKQPYKQVMAGDIVWHPYSANIGAIGVVSKCFDQALVAPRYTVIRLKDSIYSPLYVASCLKQPYCLNQINNYAVSSARISFTFNELKNIKIPKPTEQTRQDFQQTAEKLDYHRSQLNILENDLQKIIDQQVSNLNVS